MPGDADQPSSPASASGRDTPTRRWWWVGGVAALAISLGGASLFLGSPDRTGGGQKLEGEAPPIELPDLDGSGAAVSLADFSGRPVVVNFFASWCVPCRNELPAFADVARRVEGRVAFLGVNHRDNRSGGQAMLEEFRVAYPAGYDPDGEVAEAYGLVAMPSTVFVGPDGQLLELHMGEMSRQQLEEAIFRLFGVEA